MLIMRSKQGLKPVFQVSFFIVIIRMSKCLEEKNAQAHVPINNVDMDRAEDSILPRNLKIWCH